VFSRSDTATDSERFYNSVLELFDDGDEQAEVDAQLRLLRRQDRTVLVRPTPRKIPLPESTVVFVEFSKRREILLAYFIANMPNIFHLTTPKARWTF
jgi:hypothetical protein